MRRIALITFLISCMCSLNLWSQNVSSVLQGTVVDSTNAVVVGATVQVSNVGTALERTVTTNEKGLFRQPNLLPGTYKVTINAPGFKSYTQKEIVLVGSEVRDLGNLKLEVGAANEEVTVTADVTPVNVASSEKASTVDEDTMTNQSIRGRDLMSYLSLVPGMVDTFDASKAGGSATRDVSSSLSLMGLTLNGSSVSNYQVDGASATGDAGYINYEPNIDSIQELKIMTTNYQAEFGRSGGAVITVITKGGTNQFHGTGWYTHRHEQFNANDWANKNFADKSDFTAITKNRSNVAGWSLGGPAYIPGKFNTQKNKLFFFATQEFTRQLAPSSDSATYAYFPTEDIIAGNFTDVIDPSTQKPVIIYDNGATHTVRSGCEDSRTVGSDSCQLGTADATGLKLLTWMRSSRGSQYDRTFTDNTYKYSANWMIPALSGSHPRRNDVIRVDANLRSNLSAYFRWIQDSDTRTQRLMQATWDIGTTLRDNPGKGYLGSATWTINPTTVNELIVSRNYQAQSYTILDASTVAAENADLPLYYSLNFNNEVNGLQSVLPNINFNSSIGTGPGGGGPGGGSSCGSNAQCTPKVSFANWDYKMTQTRWALTDNLSKVVGAHNLKFGADIQRQVKIGPGLQSYNGTYAFGTSGSNGTSEYDRGYGYANIYSGSFAAFKQDNSRPGVDILTWNIQFYAQDNWRVTRRLTLDFGIRLNRPETWQNRAHSTSYFDPDYFDYTAVPAINSQEQLDCSSDGYSYDITGSAFKTTTVYSAAGSSCASALANGYYANGIRVVGVDGAPKYPYPQKWINTSPRLGFALDVFGNGKTSLRGGFAAFSGGAAGDGNMSDGQVPVVKTAGLSWGTFGQLSTMDNPISASSFKGVSGKWRNTTSYNTSLGIQQNVGHNFVADVSYIGNFASNSSVSVSVNQVPLWSCYGCSSAAQDVLRPYKGYQDITSSEPYGYSNYNSLQISLQRRFSGGLMLGTSYTLSKALGMNSYYTQLSAEENRVRNYGGGPAQGNLKINYSYDLPKLSKRLGNTVGAKAVGVVTDNWALSGITHFMAGSSYTVGCGATQGITYDQTGSPNAPAVTCDQTGSATSGRGKLQFNPNNFTMAAWHTLGNAEKNNLVGPGINNWDVTLRRYIPLGADSKRRIRLEADAINVFNHPQFTGVSSSLSFKCGSDGTGTVTNAAGCTSSDGWVLVTNSISSTGKVGTGTGAYTTSTQAARSISFNARIEF
jgi:hypothetical protein